MANTNYSSRRSREADYRTTIHTGLFINNEFIPSIENRTIDNQNPATGRILTQISAAQKSDVDRAVRAAKTAFKTLKTTPPQQRAKILDKLADLIEPLGDDHHLEAGTGYCDRKYLIIKTPELTPLYAQKLASMLEFWVYRTRQKVRSKIAPWREQFGWQLCLEHSFCRCDYERRNLWAGSSYYLRNSTPKRKESPRPTTPSTVSAPQSLPTMSVGRIVYQRQSNPVKVTVNCWGMLNANTPFGGVKQSGFGRDMAEEASEGWMSTKTVKFNLLPAKDEGSSKL